MTYPKFVFFATFLILGFLVSFQVANACPWCWDGNGRAAHGWNNMTPNSVHLNSNQLQKVQEIEKKHKPLLAKVRTQIDNLDQSISKELDKENPDISKIKDTRTMRANLKDELDVLLLKFDKDMKKNLNKEQQTYYERNFSGHWCRMMGPNWGYRHHEVQQ